MTTIVCPIKTITRYDSLPRVAAKYTHARNVSIVTKRVERSRSIDIIKHKYMLMCNHKIHINLMRCLRNSTVKREIGQLGALIHVSDVILQVVIHKSTLCMNFNNLTINYYMLPPVISHRFYSHNICTTTPLPPHP